MIIIPKPKFTKPLDWNDMKNYPGLLQISCKFNKNEFISMEIDVINSSENINSILLMLKRHGLEFTNYYEVI
jgi:hypothetical protein